MTENENHQIKEELLENISELFLKYGLRSTSMDDICTHLKISKKTLYQHFTNKDDVVGQVMLHRRESKRARKDIEELQQHNPIKMMWIIKEHMVNDLNSRMPANLFDLKKYHPEVYEQITASGNEFIHTMLNKLMERGIREGIFREDINREVHIYLFVKQMDFLGEPEMINNIKYPLEAVISTIVENFIRSLSTPEGFLELQRVVDELAIEKQRKTE